MGDIAIRVDGLSKRYRIGALQHYKSLRDSISNAGSATVRAAALVFRSRDRQIRERPYIWALKGVSFEVKRGDVVGVIGRNGAGKSTLLKILSRITEPTEGYAEIHGRVGSLLEVGTGFHPELTGRENIYLNGAILGMTRVEIKRKFDEIVAFSEIENFLDTPVKRYSSGMYVRLAFAVAAHLEPEILLVDEVLAVGDFAFQKKCLGKMRDVAEGGRTVLFVSHNMDAIAQLCSSCLWLHTGKAVERGKPAELICNYLSSRSPGQTEWRCPPQDIDSRKNIQIVRIRLLPADGSNSSTIRYGPPLKLEIESIVHKDVIGATFNLILKNAMGTIILISAEQDCNNGLPFIRRPGHLLTVCHLPGNLWMPGCYDVTVGVTQEYSRAIDRVEDIIRFEVMPIGNPGTDGRRGVISPTLQWETVETQQP